MKKLFTFAITTVSFIVILLVWIENRESKENNRFVKKKNKKQQTKEPATPTKKISKALDIFRFGLTERQKQILESMETGKSYAMNFFEENFSKVHVRTLRRDLDKLQKINLIEKTGSTKAATYKKL